MEPSGDEQPGLTKADRWVVILLCPLLAVGSYYGGGLAGGLSPALLLSVVVLAVGVVYATARADGASELAWVLIGMLAVTIVLAVVSVPLTLFLLAKFACPPNAYECPV